MKEHLFPFSRFCGVFFASSLPARPRGAFSATCSSSGEREEDKANAAWTRNRAPEMTNELSSALRWRPHPFFSFLSSLAPPPPSKKNQALSLRSFAAEAAPPASTSGGDALDWDALAQLVTSDEGRRELASLRSALAEGAEKLAAKAAAGGKAPDFAAAAASVDPAVLSVLKSAYSGLKLPALDPAASVKAVEVKFGPIIAAARELDAASASRLAALQKEAAALAADISKLRSSTIDEELAADPKTAKEIDAEISAGSFY